MKFLLILSSLALYIAVTSAQECDGLPSTQNCLGGKDEGSSTRARGGPPCDPKPNRNMWYYSSVTRKCEKMSYKGCYGNRNRYCTLRSCQVKCIRN
ncbi:BPTI/Kunitz domain-containing protein-like [Drosophila eugracilis]|uniref:BPTI/Kunitz domain-containing protein-like n=1 Tax=Drosophila eugracilis TaxID=29029 RepID=UPI001BD9F7DA|nr:BPTI/Kunitz domain-containing protein-like [Drosophila eugracilis]